ncbi:MAG TPA: MFS transporter [Terrimicrobiaceae bacterium]
MSPFEQQPSAEWLEAESTDEDAAGRTSTWFALRNAVFCRLWLASVFSGVFVAAQDLAATWLMHDLGASSLSLSLMATAAAAPFFLFTLPAGAIADIVNRRTVIISAAVYQGVCSAFLALGAWTHLLDANALLAFVFALGVGLAFSAPVWGAVIPDIVNRDELPSAITLGGVQLNLAGIVGPALGGFLLPLLGAPLLISLNALAFACVALVVWQWRPPKTQPARFRENFTSSLISSLRYARNSQRTRLILFRNALFSVVISVIPALLPVIGLREMKLPAGQIGLIFACVGVGSLGGAVFALPYFRRRVSPNAIISIAMTTMVLLLLAMALLRQAPLLMLSATLAGVAWAIAGSELWVAGQRVAPAWVRGRMNSLQIMSGQGGLTIGAIIWGTGAVSLGLDFTLAAAAALALAALAIGQRFSVNFASEASVDAAPLNHLHELPIVPEDDQGPIRVTIEYVIASEDREEFRTLMREVQATFRRNGAFQCRLDESLNQPGVFHLEYMVSTWAEHLRQNMRMTVDETRVFERAWHLHSGGSKPAVRHFLSTQRSMHLPGFGTSDRAFEQPTKIA